MKPNQKEPKEDSFTRSIKATNRMVYLSYRLIVVMILTILVTNLIDK